MYYCADELEKDIENLEYPSRPVKPRLDEGATSVDARVFAEALADYEVKMTEYYLAQDLYSKSVSQFVDKWKQSLKEDSGFSQEQFDLVFELAYDRGHSCGYSEVESIFDDLRITFTKFLKVSK